MRGRRILLTLVAVAGWAMAVTPAAAQPSGTPLPTVGEQPAATLLLPYFEVDLANPAGANTFFSVNNASASAALAHVTIWSEMHVPVYTFDLYLTGYDAQPLNVRDLLSGRLPQTASDGQDLDDSSNPNDGISNQGQFSQDINFASCNGVLPAPPVPQATVDHIRASLTGQPSPLTNTCATKGDGTRIARGYITVDTTNSCTSATPADPGYFVNGGLGVAANRNVLWGDYTYTNHLGGLESGDGGPLVHIRADATDPQLNGPGDYTFYGRLSGWTGMDNREPLSTTFMTRFKTTERTTLTVWRDAKVNQGYFACSDTPAWYPLGQIAVGFFDEMEEPEFVVPPPFPPVLPGPFPSGTQRVLVGGATLPTSFSAGLFYMNLNHVVAGGAQPADPLAAQAFVSVHIKGSGRYSAGWSAVMLDSARAAWTANIGF